MEGTSPIGNSDVRTIRWNKQTRLRINTMENVSNVYKESVILMNIVAHGVTIRQDSLQNLQK